MTSDSARCSARRSSSPRPKLGTSSSRPARPAGCSAAPRSPAGWPLLLLSLALAWLLDQAMNTALAFAIVGVLWVVAAFILQRTGRAALGRVRGLPTTRDTLKEDVEWAKAQKS